MSDLAATTAEIFGGWCDRMLARLGDPVTPPTRVPCELCAGSPLIAALGEFGALPHHLVHPLIGYLDQVLDARSDDRMREGIGELRRLWLARVDLDEDGDTPTIDWLAEMIEVHEFELEALEMTVGSARGADLREVFAALGELCTTHREIAEEAVARVVDAAAAVLESGDVDATGVTVAEVRALERATRAVLEHWVVWLPRPAWTSDGEIPAGLRCSRCAALDLGFEAPHLVVHRLIELIGELVDEHVATYGRPRAEPPGDGRLAEYRAAVRDAVVGTIRAEAVAIEKALALYIQPLVDDVVRSASAFLDVVDEGGDPPSGH